MYAVMSKGLCVVEECKYFYHRPVFLQAENDIQRTEVRFTYEDNFTFNSMYSFTLVDIGGQE